MKKIILLLCFAAIVLVPLSAKAEMKAMTDNEMQMVSGQLSLVDPIVIGESIFRNLTVKMNINTSLITTIGTQLATPIINNCLVTAFQPTFARLVNFEIPQDLIKALCTIN